MDEKNQNLAVNLGMFLLSFKDDVIKGLQDYLNGNTPVYEIL